MIIPSKPSIHTLGVRIDSFTNVYSGAADKAKEVEENYINEMLQHPIPQTRLAPMELSSGKVFRLFHVIQSGAGAVATHITPIGKDLSISWTLFAKQKPNWMYIGILIGVAFTISLLTSLSLVTNITRFLLQFIFGVFNWALVTTAAGIIAGKIMRNDIWHFFVDGPDDFSMQDLEGMAIVVQQAVDTALDKAGLAEACECCKG